jgi:HEPN domain-containing protein
MEIGDRRRPEGSRVNRFELQQLAEDRIADAGILLAAGRWSGAYYLAGYAVECGLKACIARLTNQDDFPRDRKFVEECYNHNLEKLLKASDLKSALDQDTLANPAFEGYWVIARDWQETSRYEQKTQAEAQVLYDAITNNPDGVLPWIRIRWKATLPKTARESSSNCRNTVSRLRLPSG